MKKIIIYSLQLFMGVFLFLIISQTHNIINAGESYLQNSGFPDDANIRVLRWNPGSYWLPDLDGYSDIFNGNPSLSSLQFYYPNWKNGYPDIFNGSPLQFFYSYYGIWTPTTGFPDLTNSSVRYLIFDYSWANSKYIPSTFPNNWSNAVNLERIYLRRCRLSTVKVDGLISSLETQINSGMGTNYGGMHYLYLNLTGFGQNQNLTLATHTANGWTHIVDAGAYDYLSKTINGSSWRVYFNDI